MTNRSNRLLFLITLASAEISYLVPRVAYAAGCTYDLAGDPPEFGPYIVSCFPNVWSTMSTIMIAIAIGSAMLLLFTTIRARNNPKTLETIPSRWTNLILFALLAIGVGGTLLNFLLDLVGAGRVQTYLDMFQSVLNP